MVDECVPVIGSLRGSQRPGDVTRSGSSTMLPDSCSCYYPANLNTRTKAIHLRADPHCVIVANS